MSKIFEPHFPEGFQGGDTLPIMLLGEAPGAEEEKQGKPFVGQSGKLLMDAFEEYGYPRNKLYITNTFWERPPGNKVGYFFTEGYNLKPEYSDILDRLDQEIKILKPKVIFSLGRIATWALLKDENIKITKIVGQTFIYENEGNDSIIMPIFHPAYILRNRNLMPKWKSHIQKGVEIADEMIKEGV